MNPQSDYQIFDEEIEFKLKEISDYVSMQLPPGWAYTVFINSVNEVPSKMFFMTNLQKDDMLEALKNFIELQAKESKTPPALPE